MTSKALNKMQSCLFHAIVIFFVLHGLYGCLNQRDNKVVNVNRRYAAYHCPSGYLKVQTFNLYQCKILKQKGQGSVPMLTFSMRFALKFSLILMFNWQTNSHAITTSSFCCKNCQSDIF